MRTRPLLLCTLAVVSASIANAQDTTDESDAIQKIELLRGKIERDDTLPSHPVVSVSFVGSPIFSENDLHLLKSFTRLASLDLASTKITDTGLHDLQGLRQLTTLTLSQGDFIVRLQDFRTVQKHLHFGRE